MWNELPGSTVGWVIISDTVSFTFLEFASLMASPFSCSGTKLYDCQYGQDRNTSLLKAKLQQLLQVQTCKIIPKHLSIKTIRSMSWRQTQFWLVFWPGCKVIIISIEATFLASHCIRTGISMYLFLHKFYLNSNYNKIIIIIQSIIASCDISTSLLNIQY